MKPKKTINEIPQTGLDCYEVANWMYGLNPGDEGYNDSALAALAAQEMKKAGWVFCTYNEFGEEVWVPSAQKGECEGG